MKNTARTTVREGRQSSDNTYVRIAAAEQNCLQALSEHRQWWSGGHISRQTVPDVGTGDREGPGSDCRQAVWRHNELVSRWRSQPATSWVFKTVLIFLIISWLGREPEKVSQMGIVDAKFVNSPCVISVGKHQSKDVSKYILNYPEKRQTSKSADMLNQ